MIHDAAMLKEILMRQLNFLKKERLQKILKL